MYTKGKWKVTDNNNLEVEAEEQEICRLYQNDEDKANALLISAAPDCYEALKALCSSIDSCIELTPKILNNAKQAINKAEAL